jgi:hypothetical protein
MQPKQGYDSSLTPIPNSFSSQGMGPSKSSAALNDYYNPGNYQNGNNSPMQDYPAYPSPSQTNLKAPAYDSQADYPGSMSYRNPREILSKRVIHPDDLRSHAGIETIRDFLIDVGYVPINNMRNPMYANHNYLKNHQQQQSSPSKAPFFQDSIDALSYNMGDRTQNREAPQAISSYNSLSYRT